MGGTTIKWALLRDGELADSGSSPTPRSDAAATLDVIAGLAAGRGPDLVGVALPGPVTDAGEELFVPNLAGEWTRGAIVGRLAEAGCGRVELVNDAHAFTLAELRHGAGRGFDDLVCLTLGTGVGGGVVLGGRLHRGGLGRAGELGHMTIDAGGPPCPCGNRGCLEAFASGPAIVARARELGAGWEDPGLVAVAAAGGDPLAREVLAWAGAAVGVALANLSAVLAPQLAVIGGGVAGALDAMRPAIDELLGRRARLLEPMPVRAAELGTLSGAIGAAEWARGRDAVLA